ncbi:MAG: HlyD family efflux transporter periplasmic adaptor subunit [Aquificae bacterium]|nr:HlyD family efflux transporter periplasmic adaptor subunit [Aquificota bacterium]
MKNKIGIGIVLILIIVFAVISFRWIKHRIEYAITDAVFVETDSLANLSFYRAKGKVVELLKEEGDFVEKGEVIARLDDRDYRLKLEAVESKIQATLKKKEALQSKLDRISQQVKVKIKTANLTKSQVEASISALKEQVKEIDAELSLVKKDEERFRALLEKDLIPARKYQEVETKLKVLLHKKEYALKKIAELQIQKKKAEEGIILARAEENAVREIRQEINSLQETVNALKKEAEDLKNLIGYTRLISPYTGYVAKKFVSVGEVIPSGRPVYAVVPENSFYILVLLEETKLEGVKVGNPVKIKIDAYPDEEYRGVVEEINPATASKFALVPRDITAGEFTKVAQRIPIKVKITEGNTSILKVGLGGEVEIKKSKDD